MAPPSSGSYKIQNFLHKDRFVHMKQDHTVVGSDHGDTIEVSVKNEVLGLVTLHDKARNKYLVIDEKNGDVVGSSEPQELQLSTESGQPNDRNYLIHIMNVNEVWILNGDKDNTPIVVAPAPPPNVVDFEKKFWKFEEA
ncbi:uncharacterized protein EDB93DRAFT_1106729 [Suillus bovinus]|uniref:uncharacterized protein n=1 Tax=Suillus bovinus TaxID=48563 RepID=UPI001B87CCF2|nr:uncharacterized protein EDB93DRAFT_1106729 [Suillus bovinus]KAG2136935.1 hypothetical protein EDB93DRAFT_1106729 [Suillus bovinus]